MFRNSLFTLALLVSTTVLAAPESATQLFEQTLSPIRSMTANFKQVTYATSGRPLQQANGNMAIARPNKFRWYILKPNKQLIVTDGKLLWVYDVDLEQASVRYLKKMQNNNPAMLLSGNVQQTEKYYQIQVKQQTANGLIFSLKPKQKDGLFKQLELSFNHNKLTSMVFRDNLGQLVKVSFSHITMNPAIPAKQFRFKAPKGVDVIGMKKA